MGILNKTVMIKWNGNNKKHYVEKGYIYGKLGDLFEVKVKDLPYTSKVNVRVQCDCCLKETEGEQAFGNVNKNMIKNNGLYICKACASIKRGKDKRNTNDNFIKQVFDLVDDEYIVLGKYETANVKLLMRHNSSKCDNFEWEISPAKFLNGRRCPKCANNIKYTFEEIKSKIKVIHPNIKVISEFYKKVGITDIRDTHYINCKCLIDGNEWSSTVASILSGCGCPKCGGVSVYTLEEIKEKLGSNIQVLSTEYNNCKEYLKLKCLVCNNDWDSTLDNLNMGHRCPSCAINGRMGENNSNYNPNLTQEERELRRSLIGDESYCRWRGDVFKKDNYTCQCCGNRGKKGKIVILNAHHLNGYHWDKENRINVDNGITLCEECHKEFHHIFGNKNNTKEQYNEYMIKKTL